MTCPRLLCLWIHSYVAKCLASVPCIKEFPIKGQRKKYLQPQFVSSLSAIVGRRRWTGKALGLACNRDPPLWNTVCTNFVGLHCRFSRWKRPTSSSRFAAVQLASSAHGHFHHSNANKVRVLSHLALAHTRHMSRCSVRGLLCRLARGGWRLRFRRRGEWASRRSGS